jgi:selenocysteine lyase/cysteine desulfurase
VVHNVQFYPARQSKESALIDLTAVREKIPVLEKCSYLNMSYGPKPTPVVDEVVRLARLTEMEGTLNPDVLAELWKRYDVARAGTAELLGADTSEISMTRHVTEGMNIVATGMDWQPGDEVIISDEEHPGGSLPWMNLARRRGVVVRLLHLSYDLDELKGRLEALIGPSTRIVSLSHVSTKSGFLLPAAEVTSFVHSKGVPIVLDGAHAAGLVQVDVKAIGCDFYSGCGHKWLMAPQGTGFLYVAKERLDDLQITWLGAATATNWDLPNLTFEARTDADKFEYGTRDLTVYGGLAVALEIAQESGIEHIAARSSELADRMKRRVTDIPGVELMTPMDPALSTGVVAISVDTHGDANPTDWLWSEHRIVTTGKDDWMRLSFPYFTLEEEVDRLADLLTSRLAGPA